MTWNRRNFLSSFACFGLSLATGRAFAVTSHKHEEQPCWGYHGSEGPDHWGHLHPDWLACTEGLEQSPVVLPSGEALSAAERLTLDYQATAGQLSDKTHTVQVDMASGSRLILGNQAFSFKQFHFHTPSEHWWSDAADVGEIHLVHAADSGRVAVLGIALRPDASQVFPKSFWNWLKVAEVGETLTLNPTDLVPQQSQFLGYRGSLTTPPCTEGVQWLLATEPMAVGAEEQHWLEQRMGRNARPVQPLGNRTVHTVLRDGS